MVADTVMRYRQMRAALAAVQMLDWASIARLPDLAPGARDFPAWNDMFLDGERTYLPRYFDWFQTQFGDVPLVLRRRAVESMGFGPFGYRKAHPSRREGTLVQILVTRFRISPQLSFSFPEGDPEIVTRACPRSFPSRLLRLRLYDRTSNSWEWRLAAYEYQKTDWRAEPPIDDGAEMSPVPEDCAVVTLGSSRSRIHLRNYAPLDVEPVLEILPFKGRTVPKDYWLPWQRTTPETQ